MKKYLSIILLSLVAFNSNAGFYAETSSFCYNDNIPASPQSDVVANLDISKGEAYGTVFTDAVNLKFWRTSCSYNGASYTELFATVTPAVSGSSVLNYVVSVIQGNYQEDYVTLYPDKVFGTKTYRIDYNDNSNISSRTLDVNNAMTLSLSCGAFCQYGGINYSIDIPAGGGSSGGTTTSISSVTGLWYDPALSGLGFNFAQAPNGLLTYYYGYNKNGEPLWLVSDLNSAAITKGSKITLNMYQAKAGNGANFNTRPTAGNSVSQWGTMTVEFTSCTTGTATLSGIDGTQVFALQKLANIAGLTCTE